MLDSADDSVVSALGIRMQMMALMVAMFSLAAAAQGAPIKGVVQDSASGLSLLQ